MLNETFSVIFKHRAKIRFLATLSKFSMLGFDLFCRHRTTNVYETFHCGLKKAFFFFFVHCHNIFSITIVVCKARHNQLRRRQVHSVWKSQKKSHSILRAKWATFTFWVDKSSLKMPKMVNFGEFLKTWSLRSNSVTRQVSFYRTKIGGKCQN